MALPTSYATEYALATMMMETIGADLAATLEWAIGADPDAGSYKRAVYAALRMAGVTDVVSAIDMDRLEAAARLAVWQAVAYQTAHLVNVSTDGQSIALNQIHEQAREQVKRARADAMRTGIGYAVTSTPAYGADMYGPLTYTAEVA